MCKKLYELDHLGPFGAKSRSEHQDEKGQQVHKCKWQDTVDTKEAYMLVCTMDNGGLDILQEGVRLPPAQHGNLRIRETLPRHVGSLSNAEGVGIV